MANIVFSNNGRKASAGVGGDPENGIPDIPAYAGDPYLRILNESNEEIKVLSPGESVGLPLGKYSIEVVE